MSSTHLLYIFREQLDRLTARQRFDLAVYKCSF